jgi:hypothetical protein
MSLVTMHGPAITRLALLVLGAMTMCGAVLVGLLLTLATMSAVAGACEPAVCLNKTYAAERNLSYAMLPYDACVARAKGVTAFICRCTPRLFECLVDGGRGKCEPRHAKPHCLRYVVDQDLGCSQKLCISAAPAAGSLAITAVATVALLSFALL